MCKEQTLAARDGPRLRPHRSARGGQDRRPVLPAEREGPAVDRERGVGVPHHRRRSTPRRWRASASSWCSPGLDTFAEVFVNGAPVLTADNMFRSWRVDVKARLKAGDNADPGALRVADREGQARLRQARLQAPRRQRSGQGDGQHVRAQGALPLRLGLGPALRHQRHLAAGRAGGVGRGAPRRRADLPEQAGRQRRRAGHRRARRRRARRPRARHGGHAGRADAGPRRRHAQAGRQRRQAGRAHRQARAVVAGRPRAAEALHAGDAAGGRRRQAARRAHDAHRPADDRGRPRARRRGQELHHQGQRRARVHEGRELDPRRQLRHAHDRRSATASCCSRRSTPT